MHGPQKYSVFHLTLIAESTVVFFFPEAGYNTLQPAIYMGQFGI